MTAKSYIALYWTTDNRPLLGGVLKAQSSRWGSRQDAEHYLEVVKENNGPHCEGRIADSTLPPEIFAHCPGTPAQALNGRCPACGKTLTTQDAQRHRPT